MKRHENADCERNSLTAYCEARTTNLIMVQMRRQNGVANHISGYRTKARDNHDECLHTHKPSSLSPLLSRVVSQSANPLFGLYDSCRGLLFELALLYA
jgi:hypothetical protein